MKKKHTLVQHYGELSV